MKTTMKKEEKKEDEKNNNNEKKVMKSRTLFEFFLQPVDILSHSYRYSAAMFMDARVQASQRT